jgi:hypothetical protein
MAEGYRIMKDPVAVAGSLDAAADHFDQVDPPLDHAGHGQAPQHESAGSTTKA